MNEIRTLQDLESAVGKDGVNRLFTEYMMTLVGKADKLDEIVRIVESGGKLSDVKEAL